MSADDESVVQPSSHLIATYKRRMHDPSIVPRFEQDRRPDTLGNLIRSHWVLHPNESECKSDNTYDNGGIENQRAADSHKEDSDNRIESHAGTNLTMQNAIPRRNHIDLRIQQNKRFADERSRHFTELFTDWKQDKEMSIGKRRKVLDQLKSCIKEGLNACPDHAGLLDGQKQLNAICSDQIESDVELPIASNVHLTSQQKNSANVGERVAAESKGIQLKAEGRAYTAIQDALLERNFLTDEAGTSYSDGKYTLLPEQDSIPAFDLPKDPDNSSQSSSSSESRRRRRKEKRRKKDKHKKKQRKSKHEKKKKHKRKSRKRSRSSSTSKSGTRE